MLMVKTKDLNVPVEGKSSKRGSGNVRDQAILYATRVRVNTHTICLLCEGVQVYL